MALNSKGGFYANMGVESQQHNWGEKNQNWKVSSEIFLFFFFEKAKEMLDKPQNNWHHGNTEI